MASGERVPSIPMLVATVLLALAVGAACQRGSAAEPTCRCPQTQTTIECSPRAGSDARAFLRTAFARCLGVQNGQTTHIQIRNAALQTLELFTTQTASNFSNVRSLDLRGNRLSSINGTALIQLVPQLQNLSLSGNLLREFPRFAPSNRLIHLSLSRNQIDTVNTWALANLTGLRSLDLSNNDIAEFPIHVVNQSRIGGSLSLVELNLSNNRISNPCNINLSLLETLRLSGNDVSQLARECFAGLQSLRTLDLSRNAIEMIEGLTFKSLISLNTLLLRNNRIATLQDGAFFFQFDTLERLELDFNEITSIEGKWLYSLGKLKVFTLSYNKISRICDGAWDFTKELLELDLRHNQLQILDAERFKGLPLLQRLALSDNRLVTIERDAFADLSSLQRLDLANNNLSLADDPPFSNLRALRELNISNNSITLLSAAKLTGLRDSLRLLSLLDNPLRIVVLDTFRSLRALETLQLSSIELVCDCGLIDFVSWFKQFAAAPQSDAKRQVDVVALCGYPDSLRGLNVFDLTLEELRCDSVTRPTLIREPEADVKAVRFRNLTLECVAQVSDDARDLHFGWLKENEPLNNSSKVQIEVSRVSNDGESEGAPDGDFPSSAFATRFVTVRSTLHFRYVDYADAATYQCVVQTGGATAFETRSRRVVVRVHVAPQLVVVPQSAAVRLGETAKLECEARGDPPATISWNKDGNRDFPAARERRIQFVDRDTALLIVDVREADAGVYTCVASNLVGRDSANASLRLVDAPPRFVEPLLRDTVVNRSGAAVLNCFVDSADSRVDVRWFFTPRDAPASAERELQLPGDGRYQTIPSRQTLIVTNVAEADAGTYACAASNTAGSRRQTARLRVAVTAADWRDASSAQLSGNNLPRLVDLEPTDEELEGDESLPDDEPPPRAGSRTDATGRPQTLATITVSYEHVLVIVVCVCVVVTSCVWVLVFWIRTRRIRNAAHKRCQQATRLLLPSSMQLDERQLQLQPQQQPQLHMQMQMQMQHTLQAQQRGYSATMLSVSSQSQRSPGNGKFTPIESVELMTKRSTDSDYVSSESHSNGNTSPTVGNMFDENQAVSAARQSPADTHTARSPLPYTVHRPCTLGVPRSQAPLTQTQAQTQQALASGVPLLDDSPTYAPDCFACVSTALSRSAVTQSERERLSRSIPLQRRALLGVPPSQTLLTTLLSSSRSPSTADCSIPHSMIQSLVTPNAPCNGNGAPCAPNGRPLLVHNHNHSSAVPVDSRISASHSQSFCRMVDLLTTGVGVGVGVGVGGCADFSQSSGPAQLRHSRSTNGNVFRHVISRPAATDSGNRDSVIWVENDQLAAARLKQQRMDVGRTPVEIVETSVDS